MIDTLVAGLAWLGLGYVAAVNTFYLILFAAAALELRRHSYRIWHEQRGWLLSSPVAPRLSMLAPAFNEESTIVESVRALLTLSYPDLEVIVINDGSQDATVEVMRREFDLAAIQPVYRRVVEHRPLAALYRSRQTPSLVVADKENGGKADALNAGLNLASGKLVCAMDADTLIEPDGLLRMVRPFLYRDDVAAVGGTIGVANGGDVRDGRMLTARVPARPLPGIQAVEYLRAFLVGRCGWNRLGGNLIISGAFGLFDRAAVLTAGGYAHDTVGEDMELVVRLRRLGYQTGGPRRVEFIPDPVAWTEVPETLRVLGRQRDRWQRGLADVLWRHRAAALRPSYGTLGMVAYPIFVLTELLPPVLELVGTPAAILGTAVGALDPGFLLAFVLAGYGYGIVLGSVAILLDQLTFPRYRRMRDRLLLILWMALESIGFRQLRSFWSVRGLYKYLRGDSQWGVMTRQGFTPASPPGQTDERHV